MLALVASSLSFDARSAVLTSSATARASAVSMRQPIGYSFVYTKTLTDDTTYGKGDVPDKVRPPVPAGTNAVGKVVPTKVVPTVAAPAPAPTTAAPISEAEVLECQAKWANAIASISKVYLDGGDYVGAAGEAAGELYGYGHSNVLFKPTKATKNPFRPTGEDAMSYFVGADAMGDARFEGEDAGFAINGGKGWSNVVFTNHQIDLNGPTAIAMGSYDFTCATSGDVVTVEYTFGYKRNDDGKARIYLHHSSVPYKP